MRTRIVNIMQYERNPFTGEMITQHDENGNVVVDKNGNAVDFGLNEMKIKAALQHKSIKRFAYALHDQDTFSEADEIKDSKKIAGTPKPRHWHVVVECQNAVEIDVLARWFCIPPQYIDVPKGGRRAFLDCVEYLTHEKAAGKHQYTDDTVVADFDFRTALDSRKKNGGEEMSDLDSYLVAVMRGEIKEKQVKAAAPSLYIRNKTAFKNARQEYLENIADMPLTRLNYYVYGEAGVGKTMVSRALARSMFPGLPDNEIIFEVGAKNVAFDGYDGQPVIIWNDFRSIEFFGVFGDRGKVFDVLETHPGKSAGGFFNVKFGHVRLINSVNIINSVQPWAEFMLGLVGEYTDKQGNLHKAESDQKAQVCRRVPMIINVHPDDYSILLNKGWVDNSDNWVEYFEWNRISASFRKLAVLCGQSEEALKQGERKLVEPFFTDAIKLLNDRQAKASPEEFNKYVESTVCVIDPLEKFNNYMRQYFGDSADLREQLVYWLKYTLDSLDKEDRHIYIALIYGGAKNVPPVFSGYLVPDFDDAALSSTNIATERNARYVKDIADLSRHLDTYIQLNEMRVIC